MSEDFNDDEEDLKDAIDPADDDSSEASEGGFESMLVDLSDDVVKHQLRGMFQSWYLDYASYTILDRAIPHIDDGLKPVQRRILHTMKTLDDGHFNKVANIVGTTMHYHPHGDASIYGALVQLGQRSCLWRLRVTGETYSPAPLLPQAVTLRPVYRRSLLKLSSTPR